MTREDIISSNIYKITRKAVDYSQKYAKDDEVQNIVIDTFEDAAKFGYNLAIEKVCEWLEKNPPINIENVNVYIEFFKKAIKED